MKSFLYIKQKQIMTEPFNFVINKKKDKVISLLIRKNDSLVVVICGRVWGGGACQIFTQRFWKWLALFLALESLLLGVFSLFSAKG